MKYLIIISSFLFQCIVGFSQSTFKGLVLDSISNEPIESAAIQSSNKIITSAKDGSFSLQYQKTEQLIIISAIGYQKVEIQIETAPAIIRLKRTAFSLKELVIASGNLNKVYNTISKIDLKFRPVNSAQEFLRYVPGLFIAQHQGGGKAEQIFLRGFDVDHGTDIKITVDGIPVNMPSHAHGQGYADMHFVIPELVKNIDYGKGSYYTEQGNFNTAGYVELQTANKLTANTVQVEAGQFNSFRGLTMFNLISEKNKKQNAYIASEYIYSDGPFESAQHFNRLNTWLKFNFKVNEKTKLYLQSNFFNSKWDASGQIPERAIKNGSIKRFGAIDNTEGGFTGRFNFSAKLEQKFTNQTQLEQQVYYSRYHFNLFSNFTFFLNDSINGDQIKQKEKRDIYGWQSIYNIQRYVGKTDLKTSFGSGIRYDVTANSELSHTKEKTEILKQIKLGNVKEANAWLFADEKIQRGNWLLNAGIRADYFHFTYIDLLQPSLPSQEKLILSPKLNFQYTINKQFLLYFKNGKGFHSNDSRVITAQKGKQILPASLGSDLGIIWKPVSSLLINAAIWHLYLEQEFVYVGDEGVVEPGGKTRRIGADVSVRWQPVKKIFADVNINYAHAKNIEAAKGQNFIPLAPTFTSTGGINYLNKGLNISLRYRYLHKRSANEDYSIAAKGYFVTDASVAYSVNKLQLGLIIENLLNKKWNEAQFATTSRLKYEPAPVTELHFTPGNPFFLKIKMAFTF